MNNQINSDIIIKTQELLGPHISKPPLTKKLLLKPPFRFIHDIIFSVVHETGLFRESFSDTELNFDNMKDKSSKIKFLKKLVIIIESWTEIDVSIKPSKIVAGLEPEKTNKLLQCIGAMIVIHKQKSVHGSNSFTTNLGINYKSEKEEDETLRFEVSYPKDDDPLLMVLEKKTTNANQKTEKFIEREHSDELKMRNSQEMPFSRPSSSGLAPPRKQTMLNNVDHDIDTKKGTPLTLNEVSSFAERATDTDISSLNFEMIDKSVQKSECNNYSQVQQKAGNEFFVTDIPQKFNGPSYRKYDRKKHMDLKETDLETEFLLAPVSRLVTSLRTSIQELAKAANPLGKLTDFLQENIEMMQTEYLLWLNINHTSTLKIESLKMITGHSNKNIKLSIREFGDLETKELNKIWTLKLDSRKFDHKIKKLMNQ